MSGSSLRNAPCTRMHHAPECSMHQNAPCTSCLPCACLAATANLPSCCCLPHPLKAFHVVACPVPAWLLLPTFLPAPACPTPPRSPCGCLPSACLAAAAHLPTCCCLPHPLEAVTLLALSPPGCYCPPAFLLLPALPPRGRHAVACLVLAWSAGAC